ncbi:MAG: beta-ketoacyl synthase N-terminal-like domain-containing protein [Myxococcota bacterium]
MSGFGFGGTNAHVLIEEYLEENLPQRKPTRPLLSNSKQRIIEKKDKLLQLLRHPRESGDPVMRTTKNDLDCRFRGNDVKKRDVRRKTSLLIKPDNKRICVSVPINEVNSTALTQESSPPIIISGLGTHIGPWNNLRRFRERTLGGAASIPPQPKVHQLGVQDAPVSWFVDGLHLHRNAWRIPPRELEQSLPQQVLMLQVAKQALEDAGSAVHDDKLRTGVFIGLEIDPNTNNYDLRWRLLQEAQRTPSSINTYTQDTIDQVLPALNADRTVGNLGSIVASRIAREFGFGGPAYVFGGEECAGISALHAAIGALQQGEIDCALVGAVDFLADPRSLLPQGLLKAWNTTSGPGAFDRLARGSVPSEGCVALVLRRQGDIAPEQRTYAKICGLGFASSDKRQASSKIASSTYHACLERTYAPMSVDPQSIDFIDTHGSADPTDDAAEIAALHQFFGSRTVLGAVKSSVGHTGAAAGLTSVARAALALHHRILPGLPNVTQPSPNTAAFCTNAKAHTWLRGEQTPRRAGVSAISILGQCAHVVLEETPSETTLQSNHAAIEHGLFCIEAADAPTLLQRLQRLRDVASDTQGSAILPLARGWWREWGRQTDAVMAVCILADNVSQVSELCAIAENAVRRNTAISPTEHQRVFFNPSPLARTELPHSNNKHIRHGELAFVYPGSGNQYPGMVRDLALRFGDVVAAQENQHHSLRAQILPELIWSDGADIPSDDLRHLLLSQVAIGTIATDVLRLFAVQPQAAIGYSLGETTALFSLGAWRARDTMLTRVSQSPLFTEDLGGRYEAARQTWGLPDDAPMAWSIGVVNRPASHVRAVLKQIERAYL